jgi:uncharacterized protein (DUF58 family)
VKTLIANRLRQQGAANEPGIKIVEPQSSSENTVLFDESYLSRLRQLVLLSRRSILQGIAGEHRSKRRGSSPEFSDFKSYSPGDDFRRIDWNIYGRLDEVFVRMSEISTELTVHILLDTSESMNWRGIDGLPTKSMFARRLTGSLGYVSLWHFDRILVTPFSEQLSPTFGPVQGRSNIAPLLRYLTALPASGRTALPDSISRYASLRRQPGVLYVISDLLSGTPEDLELALQNLRSRGWDTTVVHVIDPEELDPRFMLRNNQSSRTVSIELVENESGEQLRITPNEALISDYQELIHQWIRELEQICASENAEYVRLQTDWSFESLVLSRLYEAGVVR